LTGRKILHLTTFLQGGAGKVVVDLAKKSKAKGMSVTVGFTNESVKGYYNYPSHLETLEEVSIRQFKLPSTFDRSPSTILESAKFLLQSIRGNFPDLIHCHAANPSRIALEFRKLANFEIPIIQTMHGWGICKTPEQEKEDIETLNEINHLTTVSKSSVNLLRKKGLKNKQCSVIYNGIECFKPPRASIDKDLLEIHRLKNDGLFVIGIVGTIDKRKNQLLVLEMIKTLPREFNIKFIFIGEGEIEKMTNFVNSHYICDRVNFLGYKNNGRELIASLDLLLCPSKSEGFPVTITEAFSTKTLVLASNIPEHKEAIIEGATGFSFKAEDISDLKDKIINIYHMEDSEKITTTAYKFYEDNFSLDKSFAKYDKIYRELTNK
jgi:glycosyltransferase involved in cell wall biosynthesis